MMNTMVYPVLVLFVVLGVQPGSGSPPIYRSRLNSAVQRRPESVPHSAQRSNEVPVKMVSEGVVGQRIKEVLVKTPLVKPEQRIHSVFVSCFPSSMEIRVQADLFHTGYRVDPADLKLGTDGAWCGVTTVATDHYIFQVPFTDCGTRYQVTDDALIYYNLLIYSPAASSDGMVRMEEENVPVQCRYSRRFGVNSEPVTPTWLPHQNIQSAKQTLYFTLHLMNSDWQTQRGSAAYFLGDMINMEASVFMPHMAMRVYVESCVATATTDVNSLPRYTFIDNGCFVDGQQTGSRSRFLPRMRPDKLQLQLSAFVFNQINSSQVFISCVLRANMLSSITSRACSFIHNSWRSADGDDGACAVCASRNKPAQGPQGLRLPQNQNPSGSVQPLKMQYESPSGSVLRKPGILLSGNAGSMWAGVVTPLTVNSVEGLQQDASVGPLSLTQWTNKGEVVSPPIVRQGVPISYIPSIKSNRKRGNLSQTDSTTETTSTTGKSLAMGSWTTQVSATTDAEGSAFPQMGLTESRVTFTVPESVLTIHAFATQPSIAEDPANKLTHTTEESPITNAWTTKVSATTDTEMSVVPQTKLTDTRVTLSTPEPALTNPTFAAQPPTAKGAVTPLLQNHSESEVPVWNPPEHATADEALPVSLTEYGMNSIAESEMERSELNKHSVHTHHLGPDPARL